MMNEIGYSMGVVPVLQTWEKACPTWVREEQLYNCENACKDLEKCGFSMRGLFSSMSWFKN